MVMELYKARNLTNTSVHIPKSLKYEDHTEVLQEYKPTATIILAFILAILIIVNKSVQKCARYGKGNISQNPESHIQVVSLFEILKVLYRQKYGLLPAVGYLLKKYDGAFKFTFGIYKMVVVSRRSIIAKLSLSPNTGHLNKPSEYDKAPIRFLQGTLFMLKAETWKVHRSVLARAFTHNSLEEQVKIFEEYAKKLVFSIDQTISQENSEAQGSSRLDLGKAVSSHVLYIILHIATGRSIVGNHVEATRFRNLFEKLREISAYRFERPWFMLDLCWNFHPKKWEMERVKKEIDSMFVQALETAREEISVDQNCDEDMAGKSLVQLMVKANFSDKEIFKELFMFILVSNEGIPSILRAFLFHLALNPKIQEKCRQEIDLMFEKLHANDSAEMNIELLSELSYVEQCILETIRLYPGVLAPGRFLESPLSLDEHTTIAAGSSVYMVAFHLHRDPKYYPEPEKFDPDRFSQENLKTRATCEYVGFSKGPRDCIGKKSAILELKVLVSYILYNFEAFTNNTLENFEADMGPNRWPVPDPKVELRKR